MLYVVDGGVQQLEARDNEGDKVSTRRVSIPL